MFERFVTLREESGLSQESLASALNIRKEIVESIENGFNAPIHVLVAYAKYFGVSADYILELTDEKRGYWTIPTETGEDEVLWFIADENKNILAKTLKPQNASKEATDELIKQVPPGKYTIGYANKESTQITIISDNT